MNHSSVVYFEHALVPQKRHVHTFRGLSLAELDPKWDRPYICLLDGKPVLRKDWTMIVIDGHVVTFVDVNCIPQGGGGSNPLRMIAMLAVIALAIWAPYAIGGIFTTTTAAGVTTVTGWGSALSAGVMLVGSALVNAVLPATAAQTNSSQGVSASPTYSLQAQGNTARLESAIPEQFGRMSFYPDYAAQPYQEYSGNEQYLYMLLCLGRGEYEIEGIYIEDTPISSFEDVEYEIVGPHESLDLFPANVVTSSEVGGQELEYDTYVGPFVASEAETQARYIGVDLACPRGLYYATDSGGLSRQTITATVEARAIDDNGDYIGTGAYTALGSVTISDATATPQRYSYRYRVTPGRYEVRIKRTNAFNEGTRYAHELDWVGLRAYLQDVRTYGDTTCIGVRMRASDQLTSISSRKIRVLATRKLPVWDGSTWSQPTATRSIAWAAAYCAKAAGLTDSQIDLATLLTLSAAWGLRGDYADGRFDNFTGWWDAMSTILSAGRAKPFMQAGVLRFFRDQAATTPVCLFSMRNIIKNSFSVQYLMPTEDTADSVRVTYFDDAVWKQRKVTATLPSSTAAKPATIDLSGIVVQREQAYREGLYQAACNVYRRKLIKFSSEMEGFIPTFGDLIAIQHDVPAWGQGGEIVESSVFFPSSFPYRLTTSEPLTWEDGETHYIALRDRDGSVQGPFQCVPGGDEYEVMLAESPEGVYVGSDAERTHYAFGWAETVYQLARVLSCKPRSATQVEIECVNESVTVHTADQGVTTPVAVTSQLASYTVAPSLVGLIVRSDPADADNMLLSWQPSPWAEYYLIEQAVIGGTAWTRVGSTTSCSYAVRAIYGASTAVRVAAVGAARGPWVTVTYGGSADYMWAADDSTLMWTNTLTAGDNVASTDDSTLAYGNVLYNDFDAGEKFMWAGGYAATTSTLFVSAVDGDAANIGVSQTLTNGTVVTINADGSYTIDPTGCDTSGGDVLDTIEYTVGNGSAEASATLTVTVSASAPVLWTPTELTAALWLDASDDSVSPEVDNAGYCSSLIDKAGNGISLTAPAAYQPAVTTAPNGVRCLSFNGSNQYLQTLSATLSASGDFSIFSASEVGIGRGYDGYGAGWSIKDFPYSFATVYTLSSLAAVSCDRPDLASGLQIRGAVCDQQVNITARDNGVQTAVIASTKYSLRSSTYGPTIGRVASTSSWSAGLFGETIWIQGIPDADTVAKIEGYLAHKWGLADNLPDTHIYKHSPPYV